MKGLILFLSLSFAILLSTVNANDQSDYNIRPDLVSISSNDIYMPITVAVNADLTLLPILDTNNNVVCIGNNILYGNGYLYIVERLLLVRYQPNISLPYIYNFNFMVYTDPALVTLPNDIILPHNPG